MTTLPLFEVNTESPMDRNTGAKLLDPERYSAAVRRFQTYFELGGAGSPDRLSRILSFFSHFPYENISKIIKYRQHFEGIEKIRLPEEVMEGHARSGLGGTCFSLTFFLQSILTAEGFLCYPVMADMRWGQNVHCALILLQDGCKMLVDPGYLLNQPMELCVDRPRIYKTEFTGVEFRHRSEDELYEVYTFNHSQMKWRYAFKDRPVMPMEFLEHWLTSFQWNSMHGLCLTRVEKDRMIYLHKNFMRETSFEGKRNVNIKNRVHETVQEVFGIDGVLVEEALASIEANMARARALGLWTPSSEREAS